MKNKSQKTESSLRNSIVICIRRLIIGDIQGTTTPLNQSLFIGLSLFTIFVCGPLLIYGSFMFLNEGSVALAITEISASILLIFIVFQKKLSIESRKLLIVLILYSFCIVLLLATAIHGAGMVSVLAIIFLSGIILDSKRLLNFLLINILVFSIITILLLNGAFDSSTMAEYKPIWFVNMLTTQTSGIGLAYLMRLIYMALKKTNQEIRESKELIKKSEKSKSLLLANLKGMVYRCCYDQNWTMKYVSDGCFVLTGYKPESLLENRELSYNSLILHEYQDKVWNDWTDVLEKHTVYKGEYPIITACGEKKWVFEQGSGIYDNDDVVIALEGIIIDITERKNKEEEILYLNQYDVLTGVYNRRWFESNRENIFAEKNLPISVLVGDINGLKLINDTLGHQTGDLYIKEVARIIKKCCSQKYIIARTGGDEFIVVMPNTETQVAFDVLSRIQSECKNDRFDVFEGNHYLSISLGFATKTHKNENIEDVIKTAEDHMYRRKLLEGKSIHSTLISSMQTTLYERSHETKEHSVRLAVLSKKIGEVLKLSQNKLDELELLAMLHDIGKIGIDDSILNKPGKLTDAEWEQMKRHPEIGYRIAASSPELVSIANYILSHHEHWDGLGYPRGLKGEDIPIQSRIVAVVDAYDAMTNDRPYRKRLSNEFALEEIKSNSGKQFDPKIVQEFTKIIVSQESVSNFV